VLVTLKKNFPLHPFLLAIYPVLTLWSTNSRDVTADQVLRSLLLVLVTTFCIIIILGLILRDWSKAGLITSILLIVFFSYGHLYKVLRDNGLSPLVVRHRILIPLILLAICALIVYIWKSRKDLGALTMFFNIAGAVLVVILLAQLIGYELRASTREEKSTTESVVSQQSNSASVTSGPDIYYIILDGYGREDVLKELYGYDNSEFIKELKERGFYVADDSYANYMQTVLSLSSSLNMKYLDTLQAENGGKSPSFENFLNWMSSSTVRDFLSRQGYKTVAFSSSYAEIRDADIFLKAPYRQDSNAPLVLPINEFEGLLLKSTMLRAWLDLRGKSNKLQDTFLEAPYIAQRNRILFTLTELKNVPVIPEKKFVFAHVIAPHPPFVFGPSGEAVQHTLPYELSDGSAFDGTPEEYISSYRNQTQYINKLVLQAIDGILANSAKPPVIIIQGDHGPGAYLQWSSVDGSNTSERMAILNAYYFPDGDYGELYPSISPVNSFRVVLNKYFGVKMDLLPDHHFFSTYSDPAHYINVDDRLHNP
jgi:hypothetical protein